MDLQTVPFILLVATATDQPFVANLATKLALRSDERRFPLRRVRIPQADF